MLTLFTGLGIISPLYGFWGRNTKGKNMKTCFLIAIHSVLLAFTTAAGTLATNAASVNFTVTTSPTTGKYAPRHVLAIWVTDGQGALVQTLQVNADKRKRHLVQWMAALGDTKVDAVTSATLKTHQTSKVVWNCKDAKGNPVPDGNYQIRVEFTEINGAGPATPKGHIEFTVGPKAVTLKPKDLANFKAMSVVYTPAGKKPAFSK
jgi:hypothetical protein